MTVPVSLEVSMAVEDDTAWYNAVGICIASIRLNGGAQREMPVHVRINGKRLPAPVHSDDLGITVVGGPASGIVPHLAKAEAAAAIAGSVDRTHLLLLDHDTVVLSLEELSGFLDGAGAARENLKSSLPARSGDDYSEKIDGALDCSWSSIRYFNSGVVVISEECRGRLCADWLEFGKRIAGALGVRPIVEQMGLSVAIDRLGGSWRGLPQTLNQVNWGELSTTPGIIHYSNYDAVNHDLKRHSLRDIDRFEADIHQVPSAFWALYAPTVSDLLDRGRPLVDEVSSFLGCAGDANR